MERMGSVIPGLTTVQTGGAIAAIAGLAMLAVAGTSDPTLASQSYLFGFVVFLVLTLGCLALTILAHVARASWAVPFLRLVESGALMTVLMALLFIPIAAFMLPHLYPWANPELVAHDEILQHKRQYLNETGFIVRAIIFFLAWIWAAWFLNKNSDRQDETGDRSLVARRNNYAAFFAVLFVLTVSFASTDWVMSLEKHWFSMIFGFLTIVGAALTALAVSIVFLVLVRDREPFSRFLTVKQYRDMGNLLFTLVILWAYMSFSQYLITWSGNLTEEITYYKVRESGNWYLAGVVLMFLHFLLPFFILLSSHVKRSPKLLGAVAAWVLLMRVVDIAWAVIPSLGRPGNSVVLSDVAAFLAIGGIWIVAFIWVLKRRVAVPQYDPRIAEEAPQHA